MTAVAPEPRAMCDRCRRPRSVCYCAALPNLETRTRVVILQHPREKAVAIGTARMASLCLPGATLHVGLRWGEHAGLAAELGDPARPPILLWPGEGARDILREPPPGPVTLVVVDGTWSQARTVVRDNPVLAALPRYAFATPEPSHYRIRREPRAEYVSTIEALMHVLGALEGEPTRFRALLDPLRAMVDAQIACQATSPRRLSYRKPSQPRSPRDRLPPELFARFGDLVCITGEANAWPYNGVRERDRADELVHWAAYRPATGETFSALVAPRGELSPNTTFHTELPESVLLAGGAPAELFAAFAAFLRPTDLLCTWGHYATNLWSAAGGTLPAARLDLRRAAQRLHQGKVGTLESFTEASSLPPVAPGRAGRRLGMLAGLVMAWRELERHSVRG